MSKEKQIIDLMKYHETQVESLKEDNAKLQSEL